MKFIGLFKRLKHSNLSIENESNPFPALIPDEVWRARQRWVKCPDQEKKAKFLAAYDEVVSTYKKDQNREFLKDVHGNFLKVKGA